MHLKRFGNDQVVTKNSIHVKYPLIIDVAPYCAKVIKDISFSFTLLQCMTLSDIYSSC